MTIGADTVRQPSRGRLPRPVALAAIILAIAAAAGLSRMVPVPLTERILEEDMTVRARMLAERLTRALASGPDAFAGSTVTDSDRLTLAVLVRVTDAYRYKLYDPDGRVFWSSDIDLIGTRTTLTEYAARMTRGKPVYARETKPGAGPVPREIAEIYVPVLDDGQLAGAIEFYFDVTEVRAAFLAPIHLVISLIGVASVLVLTVLAAALWQRGRVTERSARRRLRDERAMMEEQMRLAREVKLLGELNEWLQSCRSLDELFVMVSRFMSHILPECAGSVYVFSNSRDVLDGAAEWNGGRARDHIRPESCWGLRRGRTYSFGSSEVDFACGHVEDPRGPYYCFPILAHGETVGLMTLESRDGVDTATFQSTRRLAQMCAEQISMAIANVRMRDQLQDQSVRDPLTGLYNRRKLTEALRGALEEARRSGGAVSIVSLDVDHFKRFNDNHGHDAGDMVLRAVGAVLDEHNDGDSLACRIGGEEFMMLLPDADCAAAQALAERLRAAVEAIRIRYGGKTLPHVTASMGVAEYPRHGTVPQDLMKAADDALYHAKAAGRNTVILADTQEDGPVPAAPEDHLPPAPPASAGSAGEGAHPRAAAMPGKAPLPDRPAPDLPPRAEADRGTRGSADQCGAHEIASIHKPPAEGGAGSPGPGPAVGRRARGARPAPLPGKAADGADAHPPAEASRGSDADTADRSARAASG